MKANQRALALWGFLSLMAMLLSSCASGPYIQKEHDVLRLVELINEGRITEIEGLSPAPFILDSETLYLTSDIQTFWKNLKTASFVLKDAQFVLTQQVGPETYKLFADTYDMQNYFFHYTDKDSSVVTLKTSQGTYYLLLERKHKGYPKIRGIKGPIV